MSMDIREGVLTQDKSYSSVLKGKVPNEDRKAVMVAGKGAVD